MSQIFTLLDKMKGESSSKDSQTSGVILGGEWIRLSKTNIRKCLIAAHLTRKVIATAMKDNAKIIITIYPPSFTKSDSIEIPPIKMDLLQNLIRNKIAVYSFGEGWLFSEQGGFDYFLSMLNFDYRHKIEIDFIDNLHNNRKIVCRYGERKTKIKLKDLVQLLYQQLECPFRYSGYDQSSIKGVALFNEITNKDIIYKIKEKTKINAIIFGDIDYESLHNLHLSKIPYIHLSRRILENALLGKIRRRIMEEISIDLPELEILKQEEFGTIFKGEI